MPDIRRVCYRIFTAFLSWTPGLPRNFPMVGTGLAILGRVIVASHMSVPIGSLYRRGCVFSMEFGQSSFDSGLTPVSASNNLRLHVEVLVDLQLPRLPVARDVGAHGIGHLPKSWTLYLHSSSVTNQSIPGRPHTTSPVSLNAPSTIRRYAQGLACDGSNPSVFMSLTLSRLQPRLAPVNGVLPFFHSSWKHLVRLRQLDVHLPIYVCR